MRKSWGIFLLIAYLGGCSLYHCLEITHELAHSLPLSWHQHTSEGKHRWQDHESLQIHHQDLALPLSQEETKKVFFFFICTLQRPKLHLQNDMFALKEKFHQRTPFFISFIIRPPSPPPKI